MKRILMGAWRFAVIPLLVICAGMQVSAQTPVWDIALVAVAPAQNTQILAGEERDFLFTIENRGTEPWLSPHTFVNVSVDILKQNGTELSTAEQAIICTSGGGPITSTSDAGIPTSVSEVPAGGRATYTKRIRFRHGGTFILRGHASIPGSEDGPSDNNVMDATFTIALPDPQYCSSSTTGTTLTVSGLWFKQLEETGVPTVRLGDQTLPVLSIPAATPYRFAVTVPNDFLCNPGARTLRITNTAGREVIRTISVGSPLSFTLNPPESQMCPGQSLRLNFNAPPASICGSTVAVTLLQGAQAQTLTIQSSSSSTVDVLLPATLRGAYTLRLTVGSQTATQAITINPPSITASVTKQTRFETNSFTNVRLGFTDLNIPITNFRSSCNKKIVLEYSQQIPDLSALGGKRTVWKVFGDCAMRSFSGTTLIATVPLGALPTMATGFRVKIVTDYGTATSTSFAL